MAKYENKCLRILINFNKKHYKLVENCGKIKRIYFSKLLITQFLNCPRIPNLISENMTKCFYLIGGDVKNLFFLFMNFNKNIRKKHGKIMGVYLKIVHISVDNSPRLPNFVPN